MLAVNRKQHGAAPIDLRHKELSGHHQRLLVRQQRPFAGTHRGEGGAKSGCADDGGHHRVDFSGLCDRQETGFAPQHLNRGIRKGFTQPRSTGFIPQHREPGQKCTTLLFQFSPVGIRRQRVNIILIPMSFDHVQSIDADGAGRTQDGDIDHV